MEVKQLMFGDLRKFVAEHKDAPDDVPVLVDIPNSFACDEKKPPRGDSMAHAAESCELVSAINIALLGLGPLASSEGYIPPEEREGEEWDFHVAITLDEATCHQLLRECDGGDPA